MQFVRGQLVRIKYTLEPLEAPPNSYPAPPEWANKIAKVGHVYVPEVLAEDDDLYIEVIDNSDPNNPITDYYCREDQLELVFDV